MAYKPEVKVQGEWAGNSCVFETEEEAKAAARDIERRWILVTDTRAVETDAPVNYKMVDGKSQPVS